MGIVEFAAITLKPNVSPTSEEFKSTWQKCLDAASKASGTDFALWQDISIPAHLYYLGGWPSPDEHAAFLEESTALFKAAAPLITIRFVRHVAVDLKDVPRDAPVLSVETFSVAKGDEKVFEEKARAAEKTVGDMKNEYRACGGFDVNKDAGGRHAEAFEKVKEAIDVEDKPKGGAGAGKEEVEMKTWVSFSGWKDQDQHVESAKEVTSGFEDTTERVRVTPNVFDTVHMKLLMK